jgi:VCBS repeat protein
MAARSPRCLSSHLVSSLAWQIVGVGDLDGDGKADLVWRHTASGDVAVWLMDGAAVTAAPVIASSVPPEWRIVKVLDLQADGRVDLLWRRTGTENLAAWIMNGATVTQSPSTTFQLEPEWEIQ